MNRISIMPFLLVFISTSLAGYTQPHNYHFGPGFNSPECDDMLKLNIAFFDTSQNNRFENYLAGYRFLYRSPSIGLDNAWDMWLRDDSTVVLILRGTTSNPKSILADFLCSMSPAESELILAPGDTLHYKLAAHPKAAVHTGFLVGFGYLAKNIKPKMDSLYAAGYRQFLVTGHSQGGALCYYVSSWLYYLEKDGIYPGIKIKTYASAPPKLSNMYFAYDYDNAIHAQWAFTIVNTADPVPELPFTTQQIEVDVNEPNPILGLEQRINTLPFFKRIVLKKAFNRMRKGSEKSSKAYQKYLGGYTGKMVVQQMPGLVLPNTINTTYFVRPGIPVTLLVNDAFMNKYQSLFKESLYTHHNPYIYRLLLRYYYPGLTDFKIPENLGSAN
ncbi:MAG: lipase family protein [Chitinophagaceae bacterium]|nr:lipase family protein [Chitinophagaceae bacterium]